VAQPVFDTNFTVAYGTSDAVSPRVRRVTAENPGPFTFRGTGTYIVGHGSVAVIDPGPALPAHVDALVRALDGDEVAAILVTHTHRDHSPATRALRDRVGGVVYGFGQPPAVEPLPGDAGDSSPVDSPPVGSTGSSELQSEPDSGSTQEPESSEEPFDRDFEPDVVLRDGAVVHGDGWTFDVLHTPGHIANHLCFALREERTLFSGDHVMGWSTSVVSPPEGDMAAYMAQLARLLDRDDECYRPTHGPAVRDPRTLVAGLIEHRHERERQVLAALAPGPSDVEHLVPVVYPGLDERLHKAAGRSMLAHLLQLDAAGAVEHDGPLGRTAVFRLA
jgi:glyoxylase-like metal-dependent hydrolase (beta-lactamase superfamily II)